MRFFLCGLILLLPVHSLAEIDVTSTSVDDPPVVDGAAIDAAWQKAKPILITDKATNETILLRSVHTDDHIYFLVQYPDKAENPLHKPWMWNTDEKRYTEGPHREDTFVFKWNMMVEDVNLSNFSDDDYRADVWYWKANRSNQAGFADDKMQILSSKEGLQAVGTEEANDYRQLTSVSGQPRYLRRIPDSGSSPYKSVKAPKVFIRPVVNHYEPVPPSGSRADVESRGQWDGGFWFIEISRKLQTGHGDDVQFDPEREYLFGVSIFSLYGNDLDTKSPNLYGMGRISEPLRLKFLP